MYQLCEINFTDFGMRYFEPVVPTGKWKLVSGHEYTNQLYIQVRWLFIFTRWVNEDWLEFRKKQTEVIYGCQ